MEDYPLLNGKRILAVDDEPDVLDTLEDLLPMCTLTKASHYQAARDHLEGERLDLTILDIMGVEGYALLEIAVSREVPAVMLTAHALNPENLVKSFRGGAVSYLPKEEMSRIADFLEDILRAKHEGTSPWIRWHQRMADFFEKRFGPRWKKIDRDFG